jgi:uncharacterized protein (DUF58 family)
MNPPRPLIPPTVAARLKSFRRLSFGFGPRFFVVLLLGLLWIVPAWWSPNLIAALFLWDFLAVAAFVTDLMYLPKPNQVEASRSWPQAPALATRSEVNVTLGNFGKVAIRFHVVDQAPPSCASSLPQVESVAAAGGQTKTSYEIRPRMRGDALFGCSYIRYRSRFGFAERWARAEISQTVRVLPDVEQARKHVLQLIRSRQVEMEKRRRRQRGLGREFESLRDYRPGDDIRTVSWAATARRHNLIVRLFESDRSQAVWLVLDAGRLLRAEIVEKSDDLRLTKLDYAVNAALSLAQVAVQCGDRVGLLAYGRSIQQQIPVGRGPGHIRAILDSLAQVRGESAEADHVRAARVFLSGQRRRSLVVWITDFAETPALPEVIECAAQITKRHLVVFCAASQPDLTALARRSPATPEEMYRHAAGLEIVHRRDLLLRGLRQRGVFASELVPGLMATSLVNSYLDIKERNLL